MAGKWTEPGVPHKGCHCLDIDDLGDLLEVCEMCGTQDIRYVHIMSHPEYPHNVRAGCVCAGKMEEDYTAARNRERKAKNSSLRRKRWLTRRWRTSFQGNPFLNVAGYNVAIYKIGQRWSGRILNRTTGKELHAKKQYASEADAKLAAFDALMLIKACKRLT